MERSLTGRTALVSGSSSGIGAAVAIELAGLGASMIVHGRDAARANGIASAIRSAGGTAQTVTGDLGSDEAAADVVAQVSRIAGTVDILVNVAGGAGEGSWSTSSAAVFEDQYQLNTLSAVRLINALLPAMRAQRWGRIVQTSSIAALRPLVDQVPAYCAAKAALLAITSSLAMTVAGDGVTVNCVMPGFVLTPALKQYFISMPDNAGKVWEDLEPAIADMLGIRLGRLGRPEEIARIVGFLVGPGGDWVTGSTFRIDGGNLCTF